MRMRRKVVVTFKVFSDFSVFFSKCAAILFCMHFCVVCGKYLVDSYVYLDILVFTKIRVQVIKLIGQQKKDRTSLTLPILAR